MSPKDFDALRRRANALENALIDEFLAARMGRRAFLRSEHVNGLETHLFTSLTSNWV